MRSSINKDEAFSDDIFLANKLSIFIFNSLYFLRLNCIILFSHITLVHIHTFLVSNRLKLIKKLLNSLDAAFVGFFSFFCGKRSFQMIVKCIGGVKIFSDFVKTSFAVVGFLIWLRSN